MLKRGVVGSLVEFRGCYSQSVKFLRIWTCFLSPISISIMAISCWLKSRKNEILTCCECNWNRAWSNLGVVTYEILNFWWLLRVGRAEIPLFRCQTWAYRHKNQEINNLRWSAGVKNGRGQFSDPSPRNYSLTRCNLGFALTPAPKVVETSNLA